MADNEEEIKIAIETQLAFIKKEAGITWQGKHEVNYQRELATDLTLADLARFTDRFLAMQHRQVQKKGDFVEFLMPDVLSRLTCPIGCKWAHSAANWRLPARTPSFWPLGIRLSIRCCNMSAHTTSAA